MKTPVKVFSHTCTQKISYFYVFLEKSHRWLSAQEKISFFREKSTIFPDNTRKIMSRRGPFWKDLLFGGPEENINFLAFFWKRPSFIFCLTLRSYFRERETWSSPIIRERSNSSAVFLERPSFQDVWKTKIWFSVQWELLLNQASST